MKIKITNKERQNLMKNLDIDTKLYLVSLDHDGEKNNTAVLVDELLLKGYSTHENKTDADILDEYAVTLADVNHPNILLKSQNIMDFYLTEKDALDATLETLSHCIETVVGYMNNAKYDASDILSEYNLTYKHP